MGSNRRLAVARGAEKAREKCATGAQPGIGVGVNDSNHGANKHWSWTSGRDLDDLLEKGVRTLNPENCCSIRNLETQKIEGREEYECLGKDY